MSIILPAYPGVVSMTPRLITSRTENNPAFGTSDQRFSRMGSRFSFDFELEPIPTEDAMDWVDLETESETCVFAIPLVELDTGAPGLPSVDGAGQSGTTLDIKGLTPNYVVRKGQWLNITTAGVIYLYRAQAEAVADSSGDMALTLTTMLRKPHADEDVVNLSEPKIEGFVTLADDAWAIKGDDRLIRLAFTIKERA